MKIRFLAPIPITQRRYARVFLEVASEKGLVGEVEAVGDFLDAESGRFQHGFDFEDDMAVDEAFGGAARDAVDDGGEVAGRDAEAVGIESHLALLGAMLVDELDILLEQLLLTADALGVAFEEKSARLVVDVEQEDLDVVAEDLLAEAMLPVTIEILDAVQQSVDDADAFLGQGHGRVLLQELVEGMVEARGHFLKEGLRKEDVACHEVGAEGGIAQDDARHQHHVGVPPDAVGLRVYLDARLTLPAQQDARMLQLGEAVEKQTSVVRAEDDFFSSGQFQYIHNCKL